MKRLKKLLYGLFISSFVLAFGLFGLYNARVNEVEAWRRPPRSCQIEQFSCEACQNDPNENRRRLGVCYDRFVDQCGENFGCQFVEECEEHKYPNGQLGRECEEVWVCEDTCEPEEPEQPEEPEVPVEIVELQLTSPGAPICPSGVPAVTPQNAHVIRNGAEAIVNAHIPEGDNASIYFKENGAADWQHSSSDIPVTGGYLSHTIYELNPNLGYTFGIQAANSCAGGEIVLAVIVDPPAYGVTFPFSYWEWLR